MECQAVLLWSKTEVGRERVRRETFVSAGLIVRVSEMKSVYSSLETFIPYTGTWKQFRIIYGRLFVLRHQGLSLTSFTSTVITSDVSVPLLSP